MFLKEIKISKLNTFRYLSIGNLQRNVKFSRQINDMDMKEVTREEAVLFLLSLQEQIDLIVQHRRQEYDQIVASGRGDSFHIK